MDNNTLTALRGVKVGHSTHLDRLTGCTVILFDRPTIVACKSYGGSTGTFNLDTFGNGKSDYYAYSIFISGGSWTGLQSGAEIIKRLVEKGIGFRMGKIVNPNIAGAVVFDLGIWIELFDPRYAGEAVDNATESPVERGNVGAGTGTCVGKFRYFDKGKTFAGMKSGVGCSRIDLGGGAIVSALSVVNAMGNIVLPDGRILAGNRNLEKAGEYLSFDESCGYAAGTGTNTTISVVGTNVDLGARERYERVALVATHGQVRAINPVNTSMDGDVVFVFSTEQVSSFAFTDSITEGVGNSWPEFDVDIVGQAAAKAVQESIYDACYSADPVPFQAAYKGIIPSARTAK